MATCFLILSPESCGCRLIKRFLLGAGCQGVEGDEEVWDTAPIPEKDSIVWRLSMPYGFAWPDLNLIMQKLQGHKVIVFVPRRDLRCVCESQIRNSHVDTIEKAENNVRVAYELIVQFIEQYKLPFQLVSYERIVEDFKYMGRILSNWGLDLRDPPIVIDGNAKYGLDFSTGPVYSQTPLLSQPFDFQPERTCDIAAIP